MPEPDLTLELSRDEARWLRKVVGHFARRYDDPEGPALHSRLDRLLNPQDYEAAVCSDCGGTGERVLNPEWPSGGESYSEKCSTCGGSVGVAP